MSKLSTFGMKPNPNWLRSSFCTQSSCLDRVNDIACRDCMFSSTNEDEFFAWNLAIMPDKPSLAVPPVDQYEGEESVGDIVEPEKFAGTSGTVFSEFCIPEETPGGSCPSQYRFPHGFTEIQDLVEHRNMNFAVGNIFKACYRMCNCTHSDAERDLNKILWFAKRELDRITNKEEA